MSKKNPESPDLKIILPQEGIPKPGKFSLNKFRSQTSITAANVETLLTALPLHSIAQAKDFVRLHPNEDEYWSPELCFVNVPIKGQKRDTLHLIEETLAMRFLPPARVIRQRLALASLPYDVFFLCTVPSRNTDNDWNLTNLQACEQAKRLWTSATSRREENRDGYKIDKAQDADAFPNPQWPTQSLDELIGCTFEGRQIEDRNHPGLLRLIGQRQDIS